VRLSESVSVPESASLSNKLPVSSSSVGISALYLARDIETHSGRRAYMKKRRRRDEEDKGLRRGMSRKREKIGLRVSNKKGGYRWKYRPFILWGRVDLNELFLVPARVEGLLGGAWEEKEITRGDNSL